LSRRHLLEISLARGWSDWSRGTRHLLKPHASDGLLVSQQRRKRDITDIDGSPRLH
jgi:hypothetical protein